MRQRPHPLFTALNRTLAATEILRPGRRALEAEALEERATRRSGLSDFGDPYYHQGLEQLVAAVEAAPSNAYGRMLMRLVIGQYLENRLHAVARFPALRQRPLTPPLIVTGLPRTGTTFLHRLLAADPGHHAPPYWQLMFPIARGPGDPPERRWRTASQQLQPRRWFTPELDGIHYLRADQPEECTFMLGLTFESLVFWVLMQVSGYLDWYLEQDHRTKYREYALLLRALQASAQGQRLALKAPAHVDAIDALLEAVPDAMIVHIHRDPVETAASWCSLNYQTQRVAMERLDPRESASRNVQLLEQLIAGNLAARERVGDRILDVGYPALVADPISTVRDIYRHFGLPFDAEAAGAVERYRYENPKGRHGSHRYRLEDFGLDRADLGRRFGAYRERFLGPGGAAG